MDKIESVKLDMSRRSKSRTLGDREFGRCPVNQLSYSREACALCHGMYLIYIYRYYQKPIHISGLVQKLKLIINIYRIRRTYQNHRSMTIQFIMSVCVCVVVLHTNTHRMWYNRSLHINSIVTKHYSFDTCSVCACTCAATVAYHLFVQISKDQIYIQCANRIQCSPSSGHFSCIPFPVPKSLIRFSNTEPYELNIYLMMVCAS